MLDTIIAERYAKSLFELSLEEGKLEQIKKDMDLVIDVCENNGDFRHMLLSPVIRPDKKNAVIDAVFAAKVDVLTAQFYHLLCRKRREKYLEGIARQFIAKYKEHKNIVTIEIRTVKPLSGEMRNRIVSILEQRRNITVELVEIVDAKLLGGFIVSTKDVRYDASLVTSIKKLKKEFEENLYIRGI